MKSIILLFIFSVCVMKFSLYCQNTIYKKENFSISSNISTLLCGDSHSQYGLLDSKDSGSLNLGYRSEKFIWTYLKLVKILKSNNHIKDVVLTVSYHSFLKGNDDEIYGDSRDFFYDRYLQLADTEDYLKILKENNFNTSLGINYLKYKFGFPYQIHKDLHFFTKSILNKFDHRQLYFWGGYYRDDSNRLTKDSLDKTTHRHFKDMRYSNLQISYFKKIIDLLSERSVNLKIVKMPLHIDYRAQVPQAAISLLNENLEGLDVIDLSSFSLPDAFFKDHDHLNFLGAKFLASQNFLGIEG